MKNMKKIYNINGKSSEANLQKTINVLEMMSIFKAALLKKQIIINLIIIGSEY